MFLDVFYSNCVSFALNEGSSILLEKLNLQTERAHVFAYILLFCALVKVLGTKFRIRKMILSSYSNTLMYCYQKILKKSKE